MSSSLSESKNDIPIIREEAPLSTMYVVSLVCIVNPIAVPFVRTKLLKKSVLWKSP